VTTASGTRVDPAAPADSAPADESFVARWSRRKQAARVSTENPPQPPSTALEADAKTAAAPPVVLTDKDMPPIESLTGESDFTGFLSSGVSEALRRKALYKLFHLPEFNVRCPLDSEYYDCSGYQPLGDMITHEMREAMEREAEAIKQAARDALLKGDNTAAAAPLPNPEPAAATQDPGKPKPPTNPSS
jgi:hypothetical protein